MFGFNDANARKPLLLGIGFTFLLALAGYGIALLPGLSQVGPLASSILIAVLYRHFFGYPEAIHSGIQFSAKKLLRFAIILFGLKLNINVVMDEGVPLLLRGLLVIFFAIGVMMLLAYLFKADPSISLLIGVGTGICGASAIAAVSPILKAKEEDTAISVGIISFIGTVFALVYTVIRPFLPIDAEAYGMWAGLGLHEIANVVLAGEPAGEDGLAMALLAKLGRVFLLVPLSIILIWFMKRKGNGETDNQVSFPWFLVGFIIMSVLGSYVLGPYIPAPQPVMDTVGTITSFTLTMAMVGLGVNINLHDLRSKALKPIFAVVITSILLSIMTYVIV
ncbi:putative sulfate exporter family transporter [Halobacillus shinanisalinarum]|uniref:Sulfate exporter family transporter n=1 Tax=Halobacillus shinanisalinarum TaxID=2932258 RepID=A0ABY4GY23_9BACI|nr:putative sulfate exporter family transporter [Halobacillus shinanisalinarum]UOQ91672.1 putative sulfate exporter family transporter [Halobacillus shinanisalinarum]